MMLIKFFLIFLLILLLVFIKYNYNTLETFIIKKVKNVKKVSLLF